MAEALAGRISGKAEKLQGGHMLNAGAALFSLLMLVLYLSSGWFLWLFLMTAAALFIALGLNPLVRGLVRQGVKRGLAILLVQDVEPAADQDAVMLEREGPLDRRAGQPRDSLPEL